jgi:hypothetical protein
MRRIQLITAAVLALACSLPPATAVAQQHVQSLDVRDAGAASPGMYTDREREMVRQFKSTPKYKRILLQTRLQRLEREAATATAVPSSGFDWGDAGIGAAGMLGLFSIAAGSTLLIMNRRRRRGFQVAAR